MFRAALAGVMAVALVATSIAIAQQPAPSKMTLKASGKAAKGVGSKKKPAPVSISFKVVTSTSDGTRQESWKRIDNAWGGVRSNGALFPKCTVSKIAAAQSADGCPKGSLVATGKLKALNGPQSDFKAQAFPCAKDVSIYNAGKNKVAALLSGPGSACAGVGYLPPFPGTWVSKGGIGGGQLLRIPIPSYISHPLPGILGSPTELSMNVKRMIKKSKGVRRGYVESISCKGKRKWRQTIVGDPSNRSYKTNATVGNCK